MWDDIKAIEKKISEGLERPNVRRLADYVYDLIGGFIPLMTIERSFGAEADNPVVQEWLERLLEDEWVEK
jgi:hypothetical protein